MYESHLGSALYWASSILREAHRKKEILSQIQFKWSWNEKLFVLSYSFSTFDLTLFVKEKNKLEIKTLKLEIFSIVKLMQLGLVQKRIFHTYS